MLQSGQAVPDFQLADQDGNPITAKALLGQRYLLYFYPKDDTPGCTKQACGFRDLLPDLNGLGLHVFGVSADSEAAHRKFTQKFALNFPLLADPERKLIEPIGAWVEKSMYGKKYMGIQRASFLIAADGTIEHVWEKVSPEKHPDEVRAYLMGAPSKAGKKAVAPKLAPKLAPGAGSKAKS